MSLPQPTALVLRGQRFDAARPAVMGIINRTPDSFYASARYLDDDAALAGLDVMDRYVLARTRDMANAARDALDRAYGAAALAAGAVA